MIGVFLFLLMLNNKKYRHLMNEDCRWGNKSGAG
jgi:hypothetical protein